ncbi:MAG: MazG-like family protein [Bacillota bacterium]|jgi:NTP pyrophosphatase (non-canonical NTP hydrolase)
MKRPDSKTIALPRLNNLRPTLESTALKLMEEAGELGAAIGRFRGYDRSSEGKTQEAERALARGVARELLDVAQTAVTMMFVLEEQHGVTVEETLSQHIRKLVDKEYLKIDEGL